MNNAVRWLQWMSVATAAVAAVLWFMSASVHIPLLSGGAIGSTSPDDPFNVAIHQSAWWNLYAALATGLSVAL